MSTYYMIVWKNKLANIFITFETVIIFDVRLSTTTNSR